MGDKMATTDCRVMESRDIRAVPDKFRRVRIETIKNQLFCGTSKHLNMRYDIQDVCEE